MATRTSTAIATKSTKTGREYTVRTPEGSKLGNIVRIHSGWKATFGAGDAEIFPTFAAAVSAF